MKLDRPTPRMPSAALCLCLGLAALAGCAAQREADWRETALEALDAARAGQLPEGNVLLFIHEGKDLRLLKVEQAEQAAGVRIELSGSQIDGGKAWSRASALFSAQGGGFAEQPGPSRTGRPGGAMTNLAITFEHPAAAATFIPKVYAEVWGVTDPTEIQVMRIRADYVQQAIDIDHLRKHDEYRRYR